MSPHRPVDRKKAAALRYDPKRDSAPRVVARGRGYVAEAITAVAREHHIPLHEDPNLVEVLEAMDIDLEVPPALYRAVAEVLAFVYRVNGKLKT
ncbi:MAG TPA: EscU/YscU/HrcU family type III secretion system export apparatus switch protein [Desulfobacterales bacterium]|jgi:flagellar biosynthesis protein|nr:EscU/YscU/HrcU family type III secretion system export apparatus switch protein [Desulfobacterales bacterium]